MKLDLGSFSFGSTITTGGNTPSWGTSLGQSKPDLKFIRPGYDNIIIGMLYTSIPVDKVYIPLGKGGHVCNSLEDEGIQLAGMFDKVYINNIPVNAPFILVIYQESSKNWNRRRTLKYNINTEYRLNDQNIVKNSDFIAAAKKALRIADDACWFVNDIFIDNQDELHLIAGIVNSNGPESYPSTELRKAAFTKAIETTYDTHPNLIKKYLSPSSNPTQLVNIEVMEDDIFKSNMVYLCAIRTKPFLLLAGISGTGKSRMVRQLARACWAQDSDEAKAHKPTNFEIIQVKPNWHDSSELLGYVSRINEKPEFIAGDFLKFVVKAWVNNISKDRKPYFLCLDEMNLAPVEQYFAEYLSVIESRKLQDDKVTIKTDPILKNPMPDKDKISGATKGPEWYEELVDDLLKAAECPEGDILALREQFLNEGIAIPQNLIVVGTVNMDETTYSFSRKVLDRAMTIEMNDVNLSGGLHKAEEILPQIPSECFLADAVEGYDVYEDNQDVCQTVINYLEKVNDKLDGTPFKIAYRTRNEFLIYVINALKLSSKNDEDTPEREKEIIAQALDEVTSMKILSRIEGDKRKVESILKKLMETIKTSLDELVEGYSERDEKTLISLPKLKSMIKRLDSGYTSFWD